MLFKVINQFTKHDDKNKWQNYLEFSRLNQIKDFCSLDSSLNPSAFEPKTNEDWDNCLKEDFKIDFITNLKYAKKVSINKKNTIILGLIINPKSVENYEKNRLLGFEIIDEWFSISLLTNCGIDDPNLFNKNLINKHGLLDDIDKAYEIKDKLKKDKLDPHSKNCEVIAVYDYRN